MVTMEDVARLAMALPEAAEGSSFRNRAWQVGKKSFAWERPFSKADVKRFGDDPVPEGPIVAVTVDDLADKEAVLEAGIPGVFTISHFDGYAAVLVQLDLVDEDDLRQLLVDGWLAVAPAALVEEFLSGDG